MKKNGLVSAVLAVILILGLTAVSVDAQDTRLFVDPQLYIGSVLGEVFPININVSDVQDLWEFEFKLAYNTTLLDVQDVIQGPMIPSARFQYSINETEGDLTVTASIIGFYGVNGSGTLATIIFEVTYAEAASCTLDLYQTELLNEFDELIPHNVEDGTYRFEKLEITVTTEKQLYHQGDNVRISGNLTSNGEPHQGLVSLQVDNPNDTTVILRTLQTGPSLPPPEVSIVNVYTCDMNGNPKENFKRSPSSYSEYLYINVTVTNNGTTTREVVISANAYDKNMVPIGWTYSRKPVTPGASWPQYSLLVILLPSWASLGNATVYASLHTDFPRNGGTSYCIEKSDTFQVVNSPGGTSTTQSATTSSVGTYNLTYQLRLYSVRTGNYTIYVTARYLNEQVMNTTTFEQYIIGDVDLDGDVDIGDQRKVQLAMFTEPGDPNWNPNADIDGDLDVDVGDQRIQQLYMFTG